MNRITAELRPNKEKHPNKQILMAQLPASELLPSQHLIEVYTLIWTTNTPIQKPTHNTRYYYMTVFSQCFLCFLWLQKEINDPFPPFQQQPTTTQPFDSTATHLDWKLHSKVLIQFPPWEEISEEHSRNAKKRRFPKIHPERNRSNDIYIICV